MSSRMTRRHFLTTAAALGGGLALAACAPKAEPTAPPEKVVEKPTEKPKPAAERVVLRQWYHEYGEKGCQEAVYRIAEEYSEMQDKVKIEVGWFPGEYDAKISTAIAAGTVADCFEHHLPLDYVRTGAVANLDELLTADVKSDFLQDVMSKNCSIKGKVYALPVVVDFQGLYYRNSMLEEVGVGTDPDAWDWFKVFEAGKKLTSGRRKGLFLGNAGGHGCMSDYGIRNAGLWLLDPDTLELDFNVEVTWKLFEHFREYQKEGTLLMGAPTDWWDPAAFNQGLCGIQWGGFWQMPGTEEVVGDDFSFSVFPPHPLGGNKARYYTGLGGWVGSVYGKTKHLPEAMEYTKWQWIDNTDWQNEWSTAYGFHIPARKSAAAANKKLQTGPGSKAVEQVNKYGACVHKLWGGPVTTPYNDAITQIFKNDADAKSEVQKAFELCKKELEGQKKFWDEIPG